MYKVLRDQNLSIGYAAKAKVLTDIHLELNQGQRKILTGPNGVGKSTYLRSFTSSGMILNGKRELFIGKEEIFFLEQMGHIDESIPCTAFDYLLHSCVVLNSRWGQPSYEDRVMVENVLNRYQLKEQGKKFLSELSMGQRQRLKIAKIELFQPKLLLLDEPLNGVDQESKAILWQIFNELLPKSAQLIVLHEEEDIRRAQSPVLSVKEGGIREVNLS